MMEISNGADKYNPQEIEPKWANAWEKHPELYSAKNDSHKPKKYILDMFPYPSGDGLHAGHVESYTATDIVSRYLRMKGYNVLHPQGWDAFGLPAENYAIKQKTHPSITTKKAIDNFKKQMNMMGFSYDWSREISSIDPEYYKWTQWFFLLLYKNGLAYKAKAKVNWCNSCQTVLANEQVVDGKCERCGNPVVQKDLEQWFFKITDFIEDKPQNGRGSERGNDADITSGLISGLEKVDWPESTKAAQKNWIGKSEGAEIDFQIKADGGSTSIMEVEPPKSIRVYTTRLDTIYGCTYLVIAPEHKLVRELRDRIKNWDEIEKYREATKKKTDLDRMENKDKTGRKIEGIKVVNPFTKEELPLYVADYVLVQYGTGAVMAVPAHDERDWEFADKYHLEKKYVIVPYAGSYRKSSESLNGNEAWKVYETPSMLKTQIFNDQNDEVIRSVITGLKMSKKAFIDDGILINSKDYNSLTSEEAREKMSEWLVKNDSGSKKVNYKIRDWLVSRQRYWGAPIPIIYCDRCGEVPVPESDLPVKLPEDVDFKPTGESPLKYSKQFHDVKCPVCGEKAIRESDTMDTFVCSSWYYFRYADTKNDKEFADKKLIKKWLPVDLYVGGAEHTVLHLLYSRFFTKVLHNLGYIEFDEPFTKLRHQGIILASDGRKMSKSLGNVVNPDDEVKKYGADSLRMFEMFMGPLEDMKPWQTNGIVGVYRFLEKVWKLSNDVMTKKTEDPKCLKNTNKTIKKVTQDIENLKFNTAIAELMKYVNYLESANKNNTVNKEVIEILLKILSPFAPFIAEELWSRLGHKESIFKEKWPEYDPKLIKDEEIELVIQINGKVRDRITVSADISEEEAKKMAMESEKIKNFVGDKEIKKIIYIKGRLVSIVI